MEQEMVSKAVASTKTATKTSRSQKLKEKYKKSGLCVDCGKPCSKKKDGTLFTRCKECLEKHRVGNNASYAKYHGRISGRRRVTVEWRFCYGTHGEPQKIPPAKCPECGVRTCADYWFCPWCGASLEGVEFDEQREH